VVELAREGIKVMIAVPFGIAPLHFGVYQALPDGLFGYFLVIFPFFLLLFAVHANGLMVHNGEDSRIIWRQFPAAPPALNCTR
jgi:hypothetical protein